MHRRINGRATPALIPTKLQQPVLPATLVLLPRLFARLEAGYQAGITLVSAPTGFGKTTLVASWLAASATRLGLPPSMWLSLDAQDNALPRFLAYFCEAITLRFPTAMAATRERLDDEGFASPEQAAATLIDDLEEVAEHFVIVLDDFHLIRVGEVQQVVAQLLRNRPQRCHVVLTARTDPALSIAYLRAQGKLVDLRAHDLRFRLAEVTDLVHTHAEERLTEKAIGALLQQTEGWVAGLHLALLALQDEADSDGYIQTIPTKHEFVMQYLLDEVFARQPAMIQQCLMKTSILPRFNAGLIEAVADCGARVRDSALPLTNGHDLINWLVNAGLFVIPLDQKKDWHRYHHLFGAFLQERLRLTHNADAIARLHLRASNWFVEAGLIDEAVEHALAAGDTNLAAEIVESAAIETLGREQFPLVKGWLDTLPQSLVNQRLRLLLARCWVFVNRWRCGEIRSLLPTLENLLAAEIAKSTNVSEHRSLYGEVEAMHCIVKCWIGDGVAGLAYGWEALACLSSEHRFASVTTKVFVALALQMNGNIQEAYTFLDREMLLVRAEGWGMEARLLIGLELVAWQAGDLRRLEQAALLQGQRAQKFNLPACKGWSHFFRGMVCYQRNQLEQARAAFQHFVTRSNGGFNNSSWINGLYWLAITEETLGESAQADAIAELALQVGIEYGHAHMISIAHLLRRHLLVLRHKLVEAAPGSDSADFLDSMRITPGATPDLVQVLYLLALGSPADLQAAKAILDSWVELERSAYIERRMIEGLALRAAVHQALGNMGQALVDLRDALQLAEPYGVLRSFVDVGSPIAAVFSGLTDAEHDRPFIRQIMSLLPALAEQKPTASVALALHVTLLTGREMDVLLLMNQRYSDKEIAAQLYISVATVKRHTANIYEKLHVSGRRQAVAAAQSMGILPAAAVLSTTSFIHP